MIRPSLLRIAVLALCLVLAGSGLLSAKPRVAGAPDSAVMSKGVPVGFLDTVWSFLVNVWTRNGPGSDPDGRPKNGSSPDPDGKPSSGQPSQPDGDNGGGASDPYGG
jgi:hypothetical protein